MINIGRYGETDYPDVIINYYILVLKAHTDPIYMCN
jgi:hypothetical protein